MQDLSLIIQGTSLNFSKHPSSRHTKIIKDIHRLCRKDQEGSLSGTDTAPGSATSRRAAWIHSTRPYASFDRRTKRTNMAYQILPSFPWIVLPHRICVSHRICCLYQLHCSSFAFALLLLAKLAGLTLRSITAIHGSTWLRVRQSQQEDLKEQAQIGPASDIRGY